MNEEGDVEIPFCVEVVIASLTADEVAVVNSGDFEALFGVLTMFHTSSFSCSVISSNSSMSSS